jgi:hypothetical protein
MTVRCFLIRCGILSNRSCQLHTVGQKADGRASQIARVSPAFSLFNAVTPYEASQFTWRVETGTLQTYQPTETQRVLHIDGPSGQFYRQDGNPITAKEALDHTMPTGQVHSPSQEVAQVRGQGQNEHEQNIDQGHELGL